MSIILFLIVLALLILVHEFGHFIVAKKSGIRVDEFGLGFPPKILAKKWGETTYTLNAIPFGGFVKIYGEDPVAEQARDGASSDNDRARSFQYKPKWIQASVLVAGVAMNLVFAWFLISVGFMLGLPTPVGYTGLGKVEDAHLVLVEVLPSSPAYEAGLRGGDTILTASAEDVTLKGDNVTAEKVKHLIADSKSVNVEILYSRGNELPETVFVEPSVNGDRKIGVVMESIGILKLPVHYALIEGGRTTVMLTKATAIGLGQFLLGVVTFESDFSQVSGPIGIVSVVGQARDLGFVYLLSLVALISINLAVINLLPFPALDGGRLLFVAIEAIIRRPIAPSFVRWTNTIGFVLLLLLMLVVTGSDIFKLL